ncbi:hypothetical protein H0H93_001694 [Arthromyces matolae]|nr:hypothetical protein H0H93_001694 [Arthromyces matolae]
MDMASDKIPVNGSSAPQSSSPLTGTKSFYVDIMRNLYSHLASTKQTAIPTPAIPPVSSKIVFRDGMLYMTSSVKDGKKLNESAVSLLHNPQRALPTAPLAARASSAGKQYPFFRRSEAPAGNLPPGTRVFNELLASSSQTDHLNGVNSVCTALAAIISLSLLRVRETNTNYNETSPYLDLSPLYGVKNSETDLVRAKDGKGMLSPDCFYDDRAMFHSPAYIARHLLLSNEGKKWVEPSEHISSDGSLDAGLLAQDDEIFRIAKDINCVQFKNVVVEDFLKVLSGVPHVGPGTGLDLFTVKPSEMGKGHESTIEFSLLYARWSPLPSRHDSESFAQSVEAEWDFSDDMDQTRDPQQMTADSFLKLLHESASRNPNRRLRNFAGLRRNSDGRFADEDLARVLYDATEQAAGTAGARTTPACFRPAELVWIERARAWKVGTLNQFRKFLGLRPLKSFTDWNPDPEISAAAEGLYSSIDALELYPGLYGEAVLESSGLSLGYTMTYALLVDLVTLIRTGKLTHWGVKDCITCPENGGYNTWLPKLLQRNLPRNFPYNNIYSVFPLTCPATTIDYLKAQANIPLGKYSYERPKFLVIHTLETTQAIKHVFNNATMYPTIYGDDFKTLSNGYGYLLGMDDEKLHDRELMMTLFALIPDKGALARYGEFFGKTASSLIHEKATRKSSGNSMSLDVVRDVINSTCTRWVCATLCGIALDDGEKVNVKHEEFGALYGYIFRNVESEHGWAVRERALQAAQTLAEQIKGILPIPKAKANPTFKETAEEMLNDSQKYLNRIRTEMSSQGTQISQFSNLTFLNRMVKSNRTQAFRLGELARTGHLESLVSISPGHATHELAYREEMLEERRLLANILGLATVTSINYAQLCSQAVDFYLDEKRAKERNEIIRLATLSPSEARRVNANGTVMGYIREAQRLGSTVGLWREVAQDDSIPQGYNLPPITVRKGERIYADFNKAHTEPKEIDRPLEIDPSRHVPSLLGVGLHKCPAGGFIDQTMPELFKAIFSLKNLRRDIGKSGRLEQIVRHPVPLKFDVNASDEAESGPGVIKDGHNGSRFKSSKRTRKWATSFGNKTADIREKMDRLVKIVLILFVLFGFLCELDFICSMFVLSFGYIDALFSLAARVSSFLPRHPRRSSRPIIRDTDIKRDHIACGTPLKLMHPYQIHAFVPGPDGIQPQPLEYSMNSEKAHRLSVVAIDNRDLRMGVYVDEVLRGMTSRIERNSSETCGENVSNCLRMKFSSGVVIVPSGNHTVRVEWASNDRMNLSSPFIPVPAPA